MRWRWGGLGGPIWVVAAVMVVTAVTEPLGWLLEGRYRLGDRIAAGGMGEVWRARDLALGRPVAVKLLRPGYAGNAEGLARVRAGGRAGRFAVASGYRAGL